MNLLPLVSYFFGGVFASNAIPHLVSGMMGRAFQSPFAKPSGVGLSSATVNVLWGFANVVLSYLRTMHVGVFQPWSASHILAFGTGVLLLSLGLARYFGPIHGGNAPART